MKRNEFWEKCIQKAAWLVSTININGYFLRRMYDFESLLIVFSLFHEPILSDVMYKNLAEIMKSWNLLFRNSIFLKRRTPFSEVKYSLIDNSENIRKIWFSEKYYAIHFKLISKRNARFNIIFPRIKNICFYHKHSSPSKYFLVSKP